MRLPENKNPEHMEQVEKNETAESTMTEISKEEAQKIFESILKLDDPADRKDTSSESVSFKGFSASF